MFSGNAIPPLSNLKSYSLKWERYKLANGIQVLLQRDITKKEVVVEIWVHAGSRDEQPGKYGFAHFFEHCTPFTNDTALLKHVRTIRTNSNAQTKKDYLKYYVQVKPDGLEPVLKYMADRIKVSKDTFSDSVTEHERTRVLSEMNRQEPNPLYSPLATNARDAATFGAWHPYSHSVYGTIKENQQFNTEDVKNWFQKYLFTNNIIVLVTGNFETANTKSGIEREFGTISRKGTKQKKKHQPPKTLPAKHSITVPVSNHYLSVTWAIPGYGSNDYPALALLSVVMEQRLSMHISKSILKCGSNDLFHVYELTGQFGVYASFIDKNDSSAIENLLYKNLQNIIKFGITEEEITKAKEAVEKSIQNKLNRLGFSESRTELLGEGLLFRGNPDYYHLMLRQQSVLTNKQVQSAAIKWLNTNGARILLVSNNK